MNSPRLNRSGYVGGVQQTTATVTTAYPTNTNNVVEVCPTGVAPESKSGTEVTTVFSWDVSFTTTNVWSITYGRVYTPDYYPEGFVVFPVVEVTHTNQLTVVGSAVFNTPYIYEGLIEGMSGSRYLGEWLDPTTIFITNPNGDWAYRGFYKTNQTPSEKTTSIGDVCVFDQIVFYDKKGVAKVTTHKAAFEKASGKVFTNAFSAEALAKTYDAKYYDNCFGTTRTDLSSFGQLLAVIKRAKEEMATSKKKDSKGVVRMPILSAHASFL